MDWTLNTDELRELFEKATSVREVLRDVPSQAERRKILLLAKLLSIDSEPATDERNAFLAVLAERAVTHAGTAFPRQFGEDEIAMAMLRAVNEGKAKKILAMREPDFCHALETVCKEYRRPKSWAERCLASDSAGMGKEGTYGQH